MQGKNLFASDKYIQNSSFESALEIINPANIRSKIDVSLFHEAEESKNDSINAINLKYNAKLKNNHSVGFDADLFEIITTDKKAEVGFGKLTLNYTYMHDFKHKLGNFNIGGGVDIVLPTASVESFMTDGRKLQHNFSLIVSQRWNKMWFTSLQYDQVLAFFGDKNYESINRSDIEFTQGFIALDELFVMIKYNYIADYYKTFKDYHSVSIEFGHTLTKNSMLNIGIGKYFGGKEYESSIKNANDLNIIFSFKMAL